MSKPVDEEDEFEEFEQEDWVSAPKEANASGDWETNWEDAEWDDEDPDDSFQERLREEIKKVLERTRAAQKAK